MSCAKTMWAVTGWKAGVFCRHNQKGYLIKNDRVAEMECPARQMLDMRVRIPHRSRNVSP